jgi:hypothetical protein
LGADIGYNTCFAIVSGKKKSVKGFPPIVTCIAGLFLSLVSFTVDVCATKHTTKNN